MHSWTKSRKLKNPTKWKKKNVLARDRVRDLNWDTPRFRSSVHDVHFLKRSLLLQAKFHFLSFILFLCCFQFFLFFQEICKPVVSILKNIS